MYLSWNPPECQGQCQKQGVSCSCMHLLKPRKTSGGSLPFLHSKLMQYRVKVFWINEKRHPETTCLVCWQHDDSIPVPRKKSWRFHHLALVHLRTRQLYFSFKSNPNQLMTQLKCQWIHFSCSCCSLCFSSPEDLFYFCEQSKTIPGYLTACSRVLRWEPAMHFSQSVSQARQTNSFSGFPCSSSELCLDYGRNFPGSDKWQSLPLNPATAPPNQFTTAWETQESIVFKHFSSTPHWHVAKHLC